jgi:starch synthase
MTHHPRVLIVSPEAAPFAVAGGLGEAARGLASALSRQGAKVSLVLPKYRRPAIESLALETVLPELSVPLGGDKVKASVLKAEAVFGSVYFVDNPKYFCRHEIYGSAKEEYLDNDERFTFFDRAVLEFVLKLKLPVDVIHCHDWPTALIPLFLRTHYGQKSHFKDTATVLSVHDAARQGKFPPESLAWTGLNWDYFTSDQLALNCGFNFLKAGLIFSDALNVVRADWKEALLAGEAGSGFEGILQRRADGLSEIRNGSDETTWATAAKEHLELYAKAIGTKRGGQSGR